MRRRGLRSAQLQITKHKSQVPQRGYILITLLLFFALLAIAAVAAYPAITFQIKRDREEEMIHRALEYSRGVKRYFKKFNRYPSRLEELENTNNIRFLRKRYQDPITGKDFKILHITDVMLNSGPVLGQAAGQLPNVAPGLTPLPNAGVQSAGAPNAGGPNDRSSSTQQVFGSGGPILGVASTSKEQSIREFNGKNHYGDWLFIYDPQSDRGGLLNTPVQPGLNSSFSPGALPGARPGQVLPNPGGSVPQPQVPPTPPPMPPDQ